MPGFAPVYNPVPVRIPSPSRQKLLFYTEYKLSPRLRILKESFLRILFPSGSCFVFRNVSGSFPVNLCRQWLPSPISITTTINQKQNHKTKNKKTCTHIYVLYYPFISFLSFLFPSRFPVLWIVSGSMKNTHPDLSKSILLHVYTFLCFYLFSVSRFPSIRINKNAQVNVNS